MNVSLDGTTHQLDKRQLPYFEEVLDRIRNLPGVRRPVPQNFFRCTPRPLSGDHSEWMGVRLGGTPMMVPPLSGYFQTMSSRILYGREFTDTEARSGVAVVNERFAAGFGAPEDPVGHQLTIAGDTPWKIVAW